jgi:hypothetical protein
MCFLLSDCLCILFLLLFLFPLVASKSKHPRTSSRTIVTTHGNTKNALPSFNDSLPKNKSSCIANSRRNKDNQDKLDIDIFLIIHGVCVAFVHLFYLFVGVLWKLFSPLVAFTGIFESTLMKTKGVLMHSLIHYGLICTTRATINQMSWNG